MTDGKDLRQKLDNLKEILRRHQPLAIAFSGGVDSTFLLKCARDALGDDAIAVTATAPNFAPDEIDEAKSFCRQEGIRHVVLDLGEEALDAFGDNPADRCYHCKKMVFGRLIEVLPEASGLQTIHLADGTNADDASDYRPGAKAASELGVISPLKEAGLTKPEIRMASKQMGLAIWDKPAFACLASRIPYGEKITSEKMGAIYALEKLLRMRGFDQVRVRHHGQVARIEVLPEDRARFIDTALMDEVYQKAKEAGFTYAALDLLGYKMGNLNAAIGPKGE